MNVIVYLKKMYMFFVATPSRPAILGHFSKLASPFVGNSDFNAGCNLDHLKSRSCSPGAARMQALQSQNASPVQLECRPVQLECRPSAARKQAQWC